MTGIKRSFTKWYVKKGYTFGYKEFSPDSAYWICPLWVKPLLIFFSPSIYVAETTGKMIVEYLKKGLEDGMRSGIQIKESED